MSTPSAGRRAATTTMSSNTMAGNGQVLVEHGGRTFGSAVSSVTAVVTHAGLVGPPPAGQIGLLISGVITIADGLVLIADVGALEESCPR